MQKCCLRNYTKMECGCKVHAHIPLELLCYGGSHESKWCRWSYIVPLAPLEKVMSIFLVYIFLDMLCCRLIVIGWFYVNDYCSLSFVVYNSRNVIIGLCLHDALSLYVAHWTSLGFTTLVTSTLVADVGAFELVNSELNFFGVCVDIGTSLMAYVSKEYV